MELPPAATIAVCTFAAVVLAIASNRLHLTVAAFLGVVALLVSGVLSGREVSSTINPGESTIALFFGGMVMARATNKAGLQDMIVTRGENVYSAEVENAVCKPPPSRNAR